MRPVRVPSLPREVRAEYPFEHHFHCLKSGHSMHYLDEGERDAPAVLLLHGNPTWSFFYRHLVCALRPHFRTIVPDLLGHGLSDRPQNYPYTLKNRIANVASLLGRLQIGDYHLVVHDWGGPIGLGLELERQRRGKTILLNTAAFADAHLPLRLALCRLPWLGEAMIRHLNAFAALATRMATAKKLSQVAKRGFLWPYGNYRDRVSVARFVQDIPMHPSHPSYSTLRRIEKHLPAIAGEKLLLWGLRDFCFTPHFLERWKSIYPRARCQTFSDAGHYLLEDRRQAVVGAVADFLREGDRCD